MAELKNLTVVKDIVRCEEIASRLLEEKVLAVDCQGVHLGAKGSLTLLQIGTSKEDNNCLHFCRKMSFHHDQLRCIYLCLLFSHYLVF